MGNALSKEIRGFIVAAEGQGFRTRTKTNGTMILGDEGAVMLHHTPSDSRGVKNARAKLRAIGVAL